MIVRTMAVCLVVVLLAPVLFAQDPPPPTPPAGGADTQAVGEAIEGLKKAQRDKIDQDAIHYIKTLGDKWASADDKQRKEIHELADRNIKNKNQDVKEATVEALGKMSGGEKDKDAEVSTKILVDERGKKPTEENITYFGHVLVAMGRLHHAKGAPVLMKLLQYKDFEIVAAASEALGYYKDEPIDLKKEIVGEILKMYTSAWNTVNKEPRNNTARQKLDKISRAMEASLKLLTNQKDITGADAWWKWWNDSGKKAKSW